jgi:hypothetical protein
MNKIDAAKVVTSFQDRSSGLRPELCVRKYCTAQWYMMMKSCTVVCEQKDAANVVTSFPDRSSGLRPELWARRSC